MGNVRFVLPMSYCQNSIIDEELTLVLLKYALYDHDTTFLKFCITDCQSAFKNVPKISTKSVPPLWKDYWG